MFYHANGEAKFWLEPAIELADDCRLGAGRIKIATKIIEDLRE